MTRMRAYRETFRRHRRLLILPIVLAVFVAGWFVLGSPKSYQSTASLWVDTPASSDSSLGNANPAIIPPSQQEQNVLTELLATQDFPLAVGHQSSLGQYLATHGSGGWSPTALLSSIGGGGSLDANIVSALGPTNVISTVPGPQVLQITYRGPTPAVAQNTLSVLVQKLQQQGSQLTKQRNQQVAAYYKAQVQTASQAVAAARAQAAAYIAQHQGAAAGDPNLAAIQNAQGTASTQLTESTGKLNEAMSNAQDSGGAGGMIHVLDSPTAPAGPVTGKTKELLGIFGGLFAGLLITALGIVALTPSDGRSDESLSDRPTAVDHRFVKVLTPGGR